MLVGIVVCAALGIAIAVLLGKLFGGSKRVEYYLPSPKPTSARRYW